MPSDSSPLILRWPGWRVIFQGLLLLATIGLTMAALTLVNPDDLANLNLQVGSVAPVDILAPEAITYESEVLTENMRANAEKEVALVYTSADTRIARQQVEQLKAALDYISTVRADKYATLEQKKEDLSFLEGNALDAETAGQLLSFTDEQWSRIEQEAVLVLQQVMRSTLREGQIEDARRSIPALVSLSLSEDQAKVVAELAGMYVVPNSFFSEELTAVNRQKARDAVIPVSRSFVQGETVLQRGKVISAEDIEALQQLGLLHTEEKWRKNLSTIALVIITFSFTILYLYRQTDLIPDLRKMVLISFLFLLFLWGGRVFIPGHTIVPYLYPAAAFGMLIASLFGTQTGLILAIPLTLLVTFGLPKAFEINLYYLFGSLFGVLLLGRAQRMTSFFWSGIGIASIGAAVVVAYRLTDPFTDWVGLATISGASLINGIASSGVTILLQVFGAQMLGMTTALQLMELSRPDHPLLRQILLNAPGTYQHSLQIANLAEQAAEQIGADPLLTRVGALYHDCGKSITPQFFIENQVPGTENPHEDLPPSESAHIILQHVRDGLKLARKYRLPKRIQDFITEHHGTMLTKYQYIQAVKAADGDKSLVNSEDFEYIGPRPQSRETALVMLADGSEAVVRAEHPSTEDALRETIKGIIDTRLAEGQLDDADLTARDLKTILESFTATLKGVYHPRIEYPKFDRPTQPLAPGGGLPPKADDLPAPEPPPVPADKPVE